MNLIESFIKGYSSGLARFRAGETFEQIEAEPGGDVSAWTRGTVAAVQALKGCHDSARLEMREHEIDAAGREALIEAAKRT